MWGHFKLTYEAPNWTAPNWIALNQTMQSQTKACIAKSSCVNKSENRAQLKLTDTMKHDISEASSLSIFRQRSTKPGGPL
jgi:hypothetical protein